MSKENNVLIEKSFAFAIRIVRLYKHLAETKKEFVLSKQLIEKWNSGGCFNSRSAKCRKSNGLHS